METLVTPAKRAAKIRAGANLLEISDFLISERCYGHCTERCSLVPIQRPRKVLRRRSAACEQACRCPEASTNIDVGSAQRTKAQPCATCVQSIVARQTANMNVSRNVHSSLP
jgi:hypothetical protein